MHARTSSGICGVIQRHRHHIDSVFHHIYFMTFISQLLDFIRDPNSIQSSYVNLAAQYVDSSNGRTIISKGIFHQIIEEGRRALANQILRKMFKASRVVT
jgi:hypothetical protein